MNSHRTQIAEPPERRSVQERRQGDRRRRDRRADHVVEDESTGLVYRDTIPSRWEPGDSER